MRWAGLPSVVMGPSVLGKGVKTSPTAAQLGLIYAQTMPCLPRVCLRQVELFEVIAGKHSNNKKTESSVFFFYRK